MQKVIHQPGGKGWWKEGFMGLSAVEHGIAGDD